VIVNEPGALIVRESSRFPARGVGGFPESVQVSMKTLAAAAAFGVPEIIPVLALRFRPAGSVPDVIDQVKGDVPPCTNFIRFREKGCPAVANCGCTGGGLITESVGLTVT
jgi:hypothetical protein